MTPHDRPADPDRVPDVDRGPTRPLSDRAARMAARAAMTDRKARFRDRLDDVRRREARRARRAAAVERAVVVLVLAGGVLGGLAVAGLLDLGWWPAGLAGGLVGVLVLGLRRASRRRAEARGATAWDWTTGRHVPYGDPSRRVQEMTGGTDRRSGVDRRR